MVVSLATMKLLELYKQELENPNTAYFIFDTKGTEGAHGDIDFIQYRWHTHKYNQVKEGDLFIYRKPQRATDDGMFYLFGTCKVQGISGEDEVMASLTKIQAFGEIIRQDALERFIWKEKLKGSTWANFWNQYGMNKIEKEDFINLLLMYEKMSGPEEEIASEEETQALKQIQLKDYFAEDETSQIEVRAKQSAFSKKVKIDYDFKCAICRINTGKFLVGSHIIPWAKDKNNRLNPSNGICLCVLHDRAFDSGYLTIDDDYQIKLSMLVEKDEVLNKELQPFAGKKIDVPKNYPPDPEFLRFHREHIFKDF